MAFPRSTGAAPALLSLALLSGCGEDASPPGPDPACAAVAQRDQGGVRIFTVQPRIEPEALTSYEAFRAPIERLIDERVRPCLAADRPNLIVFPENLGLHAAFIGSRGEAARGKTTATAAFLALAGPYAPAVEHYKLQWPDLGLIEGLVLGLTDTLWRAFHETARGVAVSTGAHVIASTDVSGTIDESSAPEDLAALADPDLPGVTSVFVARDRAVYNAAYVFSPDGAILAAARKPYLVPSEESQLLLTHGPLRDIAPVDLGFARIGIATSKDAWMPDVIDRLESMGADLLVQPEAFIGWGIEELPGDWLPAVFQQSGWAAVQKHGGLRHAAIPHLTGNLFDLVFDGQSAVIADAVPGEARIAYVGQEPAGGFLAVAPWILEDPGVLDPSISMEARRSALRAAGEAVLPGGARANEYVETVIAADVDPAAPFPAQADGPPGALGASAEIAPSGAGEQVSPVLSAGAGGVFLAWQDDRDGRPQIYAARSTDGGATFGEARAVAPSDGEQRAPAIVAIGAGAAIAWQERSADGARILVARSDDGETFGASMATGGVMAGEDAWGAALAEDNGALVVAFSALIKDNERILVGRTDAAGAWSVTPADPDPPASPAGNPRNDQWSPAIAARGGVVAVAWVDFRDFNWDVLASRSMDGGQTFSPPARVDDGTDGPERIHDDPSLIFLAGGELACGWSDVRLRKTPAKARVARIGAAGASPSEVLGAAPEGAPAWRPELVALEGGAVGAVWQDFRTGGNDIYLAVSEGGAPFGEERRVDDGGEGPSYQFAPAIAAAGGGRVVVTWEDTRSGQRRIRAAAGTP